MDKVKCIRVNFQLDEGRASRGEYDTRGYDYLFEGTAEKDMLAAVRVGNVVKVVKIIEVFRRRTIKASKYAVAVFSEQEALANQSDATKRAEILEEIDESLREILRKKTLERLVGEANDEHINTLMAQFRELGGV